MNNIVEYIKSWFTKFSSPSAEDIKTIKKDANSITFSIDGFGKQWVYVELVNTDEHSCQAFAKLLFELNDGRYKNSILNIVTSLTKEHPVLSPAVDNILINWGILLNQSIANGEQSNIVTKSKNRPFIRPRNAFLGGTK